jgi:glycerate kinase
MDMYDFDEKIEDVDLIVTGEGRIDYQSLNGKVIQGIAKKARNLGIPVIAIVGAIGDGAEAMLDEGVTSIFSINTKAEDYTISRLETGENIEKTMRMVMRLIKYYEGL